MADLQVDILSPAKVIAKVKAAQVQVPGIEGYLGILPGHAKFITELGVGELKLDGGEAAKQTYFVAGGYIEVFSDKVTVLVDVIERPADIDVARAEKARDRALDRLDQKSGVDVVRAQAALLRASRRIEVSTRYR